MMKMKSFVAFAVVVFFASLVPGFDALFCNQCMTLKCEADQATCEVVRQFVIRELNKYYDFQDGAVQCPESADQVAWKAFKLQPSMKCRAVEQESCGVANFKVTTSINTEDLSSTRSRVVTYGKVLGCLHGNLIARTPKAWDALSCFTPKPSTNGHHELTFEQQLSPDYFCKSDFCVKRTVSDLEPKLHCLTDGDEPYWQWTWKQIFMVSIVILVILFVVIMVIGVFRQNIFSCPTKARFNPPKSGKDENCVLKSHNDTDTLKSNHDNPSGSVITFVDSGDESSLQQEQCSRKTDLV